ncbi:MAG: hypothetical protein N2688_13485 [Burkholderiaceae bacterium]|nr:hypothetical protein [Burkholderiaceae bacterium]
MKVAVLLCLLLAAAPAAAQEAPNPYDQAALRVRIAQLELELSRTRDARMRLENRLRELQDEIDRLRLQREQLAAEEVRLRNAIVQAQGARRP